MSQSVLEQSYLFKHASADDLEAVQHIAEKKEALGGEEIFLSGSDSDALFIVVSGAVATTLRGHEHATVTVGPGQIFGDVPFFCDVKRAATAKATEVTHYLRISYAALGKLLEARPALSAQVYRNAAAFYSRLAGRLSDELKRPYC